MKKFEKLKGVKLLTKSELKNIFGKESPWLIEGDIGERCSSHGSEGYIYCKPGLSCVNIGTYFSYYVCGFPNP